MAGNPTGFLQFVREPRKAVLVGNVCFADTCFKVLPPDVWPRPLFGCWWYVGAGGIAKCHCENPCSRTFIYLRPMLQHPRSTSLLSKMVLFPQENHPISMTMTQGSGTKTVFPEQVYFTCGGFILLRKGCCPNRMILHLSPGCLRFCHTAIALAT